MENQPNPNNRAKILIVEDDESLRNVLVKKLEDVGYEVSQAKNGRIGLNSALTIHPDLILLDIIMPEMDGYSVLDTIRADPWGKYVKVIILTNLGIDEAKLSEVVKDNPSYYLMKSENTLDQILDKVREILNSKTEMEVN